MCNAIDEAMQTDTYPITGTLLNGPLSHSEWDNDDTTSYLDVDM